MTNDKQNISGDRNQAEQRFGQEDSQGQSSSKGGINSGVSETDTRSTREEDRLGTGNTFASGEQGRTNTNRNIEGESQLEEGQMEQGEDFARARKASGAR